MNQRINAFEQIYRRWIGGFISETRAMSEIHEVMNRKFVTVNSMKIVDTSTGGIMYETGYTTFSYR
ncbi:hypothetical protein [Paenibacillus oleatilyticus]|uniref:hypothetical protein n=1 Tax=Paenibacillus oleatilyticus TaxID=2594886 RepID=UPI001C1FB301|nr:hypothetical protein [Paenibacillus oleatilyticus]MBU7315957.1 hypothetical protein [Paenibacillus oleatilyticus]